MDCLGPEQEETPDYFLDFFNPISNEIDPHELNEFDSHSF
jgi:hypothetical protein